MDRIKVLSTALSNMIAAGEVIERPSSVIKELVENAIDAQATRIEIHVKEAGRHLIEVLDNGQGMSEKDLRLSITRHATSKIQFDHDLFRIKTLGFRGEALPSIAAVSHLVIATAESQGPGHQLICYQGEETFKKAPSRQGTLIEVKDLFYNTPARLKYLKNDYIETSSCIDVVSRIALAHPAIAWQMKVDDRIVFSTDGRGDLLQVIAEIFGVDLAKQLVPISFSTADVQVHGFLGLPSIAKSHRYAMYTLVNGRAVTMGKINQMIQEAYQPYLPPVRFPFVVLVMAIEPNLLDVNVHPAKREIRFSKEESLRPLLKQKIQEVLQSHSLAHQVITPPVTSQPNSSNLTLSEPEPEKIETFSLTFQGHQQPSLTAVAQLHLTYIVCVDQRGSIVLIDQHAADERIRYEHHLNLVQTNRHATVPLIPLMIDVKPSDAKLLTTERLNTLAALGLILEPFGANAFKVNQIPTWALDNNPQLFIEDLLMQIFEEKNLSPDALRLYALASKACKTAIKAQDRLDVEAMQSLVNRLLACDYPYSCPHGRPTIIQWSKTQIEALFNRSGF
jgi:DNA mismatch repair protein MutL